MKKGKKLIQKIENFLSFRKGQKKSKRWKGEVVKGEVVKGKKGKKQTQKKS